MGSTTFNDLPFQDNVIDIDVGEQLERMERACRTMQSYGECLKAFEEYNCFIHSILGSEPPSAVEAGAADKMHAVFLKHGYLSDHLGYSAFLTHLRDKAVREANEALS